MYVNVQSLVNKLEQLELIARMDNVDIFCLSEHWLSFENLTNVNLLGYSLSSFYCRKERLHGGVAIFSSAKFKFKLNTIDMLDICDDLSFECCCSVLTIGQKTYGVLLVYRSPLGCVDTFFERLSVALERVIGRCDYVILCGDFNIDAQNKCIKTDMLFDIFDCYEMAGDWTRPTRTFTNCNGVTSESVIDYAATNLPGDMFHCIWTDLCIADHLGCVITLSATTTIKPEEASKPAPVLVRDLRTENMEQFRFQLGLVNWQHVFEDLEGINEMFCEFLNVFNFYYDFFCPQLRVVGRDGGGGTWVSVELKGMRRDVQDLFYLSRRYPQLLDAYVTKKNIYKSKVKEAKRSYFTKRIHGASNVSRELWRCVNIQLGRKEKQNRKLILKQDGKEIVEENEVSDFFCEHFVENAYNNVVKKYGDLQIGTCTKISTHPPLCFLQ